MTLANLGCGIIEGFYGPPWSWGDRCGYAEFLSKLGFGFYLYAPKRCEYLRRQWMHAWPAEDFNELLSLRSVYADAGIQFGIGLSPYSGGRSLTAETRTLLRQKVRFLNQLRPDLMGVFFDDMPHNPAHAVAEQIQTVSLVADETAAATVVVCPTYYSYDPVLEKFSGPAGDYLQQLGTRLDPAIHIFWTGPKVCSREISAHHLQDIASTLGRPVLLWDNYPVNDGISMSRFLHLGAFRGRTEVPNAPTSGHAVNPMNQAQLSKIPIATLADVYRDPVNYDADRSFLSALRDYCTPAVARQLENDFRKFQDGGLDSLSAQQNAALQTLYTTFDDAFAREVRQWLAGDYAPLAADLAEFAEYQT